MSKNTGNLQDKSGNSLFPNVIDTVSNSNGTALKFADGTMICYGKRTWTGLNNNVVVGGLYYTGILSLGDYPTPFIEVPCVYINACVGPYNIMEYNCRNSLTSIGDCFLANGTSRNNQSSTVCYIAIGKWK